jgi:excisionase family DNA binding protein
MLFQPFCSWERCSRHHNLAGVRDFEQVGQNRRRSTVDRALVSRPEASEALHLGKTKVKELVARGELLSVKIGKSRRIPVTAIQAYIDRPVGESCAEVPIASYAN